MNNFNILILEDETFIALRIKQLLEKHHYHVVGIATESEGAIDYINTYNIQLILADITIDGYLNGIETVALIQKSYDIPAIFLTSHQEDQFLEQAAQVNFLGYIVKPFIEETFIREIKLAYLRYCNKKDSTFIDISPYSYNLETQSLQKDFEEIMLGKHEKSCLHILISNKNTMVSNEQIDLLVWNDEPVDDLARRQLIFRLRKKLPELNIETIKGLGYKLIV